MYNDLEELFKNPDGSYWSEEKKISYLKHIIETEPSEMKKLADMMGERGYTINDFKMAREEAKRYLDEHYGGKK